MAGRENGVAETIEENNCPRILRSYTKKNYQQINNRCTKEGITHSKYHVDVVVRLRISFETCQFDPFRDAD